MFDKIKKEIEGLRQDIKTLNERIDYLLETAKEGDSILIVGFTARNTIELENQTALIEAAVKRLDVPGKIHILVVPNGVEIEGFERIR